MNELQKLFKLFNSDKNIFYLLNYNEKNTIIYYVK